jgi:peptidylprolyl isomerase
VIGCLAAATLAVGVAACGGHASGAGCAVTVSSDVKSKPQVKVPHCNPPVGLQIKDIVTGSGAAAKAGDAVAVQYVGISWSTGSQFDASWDNGAQPFVVQPLGRATVIKGWNLGLVGVRVGTRRLLVIPPVLGYGASGSPPAIKPNETLVFVVDVVGINS